MNKTRGAQRRARTAKVTRSTLIFAILNVTPDSFSDGGRWENHDDAIAHGIELHEQGADVIDVGGESTRPGAASVSVEEELARVLPVVRGLVERGIAVSVDTRNASTALATVEAGAAIINDVSGGLRDPEMYRVVAATKARYIAMHSRGTSETMNDLAVYDDVVKDVRRELEERVAELLVWGVDPQQVIIDPGLGFAKTTEQNFQLLGHLDYLAALGFPVFVGASRKRFLSQFVAHDAPPTERDGATAVVSALSARAGAWAVRVHDVPSTKVALDVAAAWTHGAKS